MISKSKQVFQAEAHTCVKPCGRTFMMCAVLSKCQVTGSLGSCQQLVLTAGDEEFFESLRADSLKVSEVTQMVP